MTNRVRELAEQAGEEVVSEVFEEYMITETSDGAELKVPAIFIEKFAELIVLECVNAVMDGTKEGDHYAMRIEQHFNNGQGGILHFGVEE